MFLLYATNPVLDLLTGASTSIHAFVLAHGYIAVIVLMALESASLPLPSEVILPVTGYFVHTGTFNLYLAVLASMIGTVIGITVDYYVAYYLGKEVVYAHAESFHIKRGTLERFDAWFNNNAGFTVFVARLIPVVRGLISFPAGFAQMDLKRFYLYSIAGSLIWNVALIEFGYYTLGAMSNNLIFILVAFGLLAQLLYIVYKTSMKKINADNRRNARIHKR